MESSNNAGHHLEATLGWGIWCSWWRNAKADEQPPPGALRGRNRRDWAAAHNPTGKTLLLFVSLGVRSGRTSNSLSRLINNTSFWVEIAEPCNPDFCIGFQTLPPPASAPC